MATAHSQRKLARYRSKRNFTRTAEPSGQAAGVQPSPHLRYVIQKHDARRLHFDLRLELDGVFKSWAVTKGPSIDPADKRLAVEVEDHPLDYGDFEGTIPKGEYGGGTVQLWDRGFWAPLDGQSPQQALRDGELKFVLVGERLQGSWVLVRIKHNRDRSSRTNWLLIKHRDQYAKANGTAALMAEDRSVASDRTMDQIARGTGKRPKPFMLSAQRVPAANAVWHSKGAADSAHSAAAAASPASPASTGGSPSKQLKRPPSFIEPQLCKLVDRPPDVPGWGHEVKFDGYRVQVQISGHEVHIRTRSGLDWTPKFSAIATDLSALDDCILDGEIVALDQRMNPSFAALQAALSAGKSEALVLFVFDLLIQGHDDLRSCALRERKSRLQALLKTVDSSTRVRYVEHFETGADALLASACKLELEGIVSKRLDAPYVSGRSGSWTKAKCRTGHEVVLGGWTTQDGTLRSLLAGVNRDGHLVYVGRIGTGYADSVVAQLLPKLRKLTVTDSPFTGDNAPRRERNVRWLKPTLVAEIQFAGWTGSGMIRQAAFKGLRMDKPAREVVAELPTALEPQAPDPEEKLGAALHAASTRVFKTAGAVSARSTPSRRVTKSRPVTKSASHAVTADPLRVMGVLLSKADKQFWPDAGDGVPVTKLDLARYYESIGDWMLPHLTGRPCSLVRAPDGIAGQQFFQRHAMPGISNLLTLVKVKGDKQPYVQIDRVEALAAVAQMGGLEIHGWNCEAGNPEMAGRLVFDLDPSPDVAFDAVIAAALEVRDRLKVVGLESFCKTTGGKGLHVVTPLQGGAVAIAWPQAKDFAHVLCAQMAADAPDRYLDNMSKAQRKGRIFLDYLRNDRTATAVAPLSSRARAGATVSMPIRWEDVRRGLDPTGFTIRTAPAELKRLKPWQGYERAARPLGDAIRRMVAADVPRTDKSARRRPAKA